MSLTHKTLDASFLGEERIETIIADPEDARERYDKEVLQAGSDDLRKDEGGEDYKAKYEREHSAFEAYKNEQRQKEIKAAKERAFREIIEAAGISRKRIDAVLRISDLDELVLDENGKAKNGEALVRKIREDFSDFVITRTETGAEVMSPPDADEARDLGKLDMAAYIAERKKFKKG